VADDTFSPLFFQPPAFALLVGINKYQYGQPPDDGMKLDDKMFRNLKVAVNDATDFGKFLRTHGFIDDAVDLLLEERATRTNIRMAFKKLSRACQAPGAKEPLVIVYFSGHGAAEEGDYYLVPHEGERDRLFGTAISNSEFKELLGTLKTNRLVVFLDACHAGGLAGKETPDSRGGGESTVVYEPRGLGEGTGRIVIASCMPGQFSYEAGENGIFTGKLLSLLRGESPDFADKEEITALDLYTSLRQKVMIAAVEQKKEQEPQIEAKATTGIVLAINQGVRQKRQDADREGRQKRCNFLGALENQLRTMWDLGPTSMVAGKLRSYVGDGTRKAEKDAIYEAFHRVFEDSLKLWSPGFDLIVRDCCEYLIATYGEAIEKQRSSSKAASVEPSNLQDRLDVPPRQPLVPQEVKPALGTPPPLSEQQKEMRQLSEADLTYILFDIRTKVAYWREQAQLTSRLSQPIAEAEFAGLINSISLKHKDQSWEAVLEVVVDRFQERWPSAMLFQPESNPQLAGRVDRNKE